MKALAQLRIGAHIAIAIFIGAGTSARAVFSTLYPGGPISAQEHVDMAQHPYASLARAMLPGVVAGLLSFVVFRGLAKKNDPDISN
jgi:hypothetical protein